MIIKVLLISVLVGVLIYAGAQRNRAPVLSIFMALFSMTGGAFVIMPELTNQIAQIVGVGRGADLVLYCFVVLMLVAVFNIHLRLRSEKEDMTKIARALAIMAAKDQRRGSK